MKSKKKKAWFYPVRNSYLPASWQGLIIYGLFVAYVVVLPLQWYQNGYNLWILLTVVLPLMVAATVLTQFIASKTSR